MKSFFWLLALLPFACSSNNEADVKRYKEQAARITIVRDRWGIPHIYGKTDADAVFGLMYAQCEENFERVERNYIERFGRLAETEGENYLYEDLKSKFVYDTSAAIADYHKSPAWLKKLLQAFADGINYYLYKHPETKPLLLKHFEPWYALMQTDGAYIATQLGGLLTDDVKNMYPLAGASSSSSQRKKMPAAELQGSNSFAVAPAKTTSKNAMLYINPHVSFYFRMEAHMVSEEGLNAYGAVTWGQFFIFQGFNAHCGWMHTSSMADAADLYEEKVIKKGEQFFYEYDGLEKPLTSKKFIIKCKKGSGTAEYPLTIYYTHHGVIAGARNGKWLSLKEQNRSLNSLIQSWQRTKSNNYDEFEKTMMLLSNSSTNTTYADDKGNIAYWHSNFIPRRNTAFNWAAPVDGSIAATEWQGVHALNEIVYIKNPVQGWIQNCNSSPFNVSGYHTLNEKNYPAYMAPDGENFRSALVIKELEKENNYTLDKLIALGYNNYLAAFDSLLPPLFQAYDSLKTSHAIFTVLNEPVMLLKLWDKRSSVSSVAASLAIEWAYNLMYNFKSTGNEFDQVQLLSLIAKQTSSQKRLELLYAVVKGFEKIYGTWKVAWGDINRYQRLTGNINEEFSDDQPSIPVGMASALFGSLPAYETLWQDKKGYGYAGNSFVAAVEFGKRITAKAVSTGGQSFKAKSKHFTDQAKLYTEGKLRDVLFYKEDVLKHAESNYHPGEEKN